MKLSEVSIRTAWIVTTLVSCLAFALIGWLLQKEQPPGGESMLTFLPLTNSILNGASAFCLVAGVVAVRKGKISTHKRWMAGAFACSAVFLVGYLLHHYLHGDTHFPKESSWRPVYLIILATHILASVVCLPMVFMTFFLSLSDRLAQHRKLARFTFPTWLYVSVTGVLVFVMLRMAGADS